MTELDAQDLAAPGWDQASAGFNPVLEGNPHRERLWWQSRLVTWVAAALQLLPLAILAGDITDSERPAVAVLVAFSVAMALTPWLMTNLFNLFYPVLLCMAYWAWTGGLAAVDLAGLMEIAGRFLGWLYLEGNTWEIWLLRMAMAAAAGQIGYKAVRMWGCTPADRDAIRRWWRRPKNDETPEHWA